MSQTIVIGDIHGCYDELVALLELVQFKSEDRLIAVGDLIVKGNKNKEVLDWFVGDSRFTSVIGNHDLALLRHWRGENGSLKKSQAETAKELESRSKAYCDYLASLPLMIDLGDFLVVHAGVRPGISLDKQSIEDLTELRTLGLDRTSRTGIPWFQVYDSEKVVLFGHWPTAEPTRAPHAIGLDTGCVYGNRLSAFIVETREIVSVPAFRAYDRPKKRLAAAGSNPAAD
jgi:diadenosine tetraphosphatase ApaH/serine/threonine PP2A family protein phosphatase